jgi:nucleoid-associated protein YgaU
VFAEEAPMTRTPTATTPAGPATRRPAARQRPVRYGGALVRCAGAARPMLTWDDAPTQPALALPGAPAPATQRPAGVRLTRRGRALLTLLVVTLLTVAFSLGRVSSEATGAATAPARRTIVVQPGQTLWEIARVADPQADPREVVRRIEEINDLRGAAAVRPGQQLLLP